MVMWLNNLTPRPGSIGEWRTAIEKAGIDHSSGTGRRLADGLLLGVLSGSDLFDWATGETTAAVAAALAAGATDQRKYIPRTLRLAVFQRDDHACLACGSTENLACDHVIPESRGGETTPENLQTLCATCNSIKLMSVEMTLEEIAVRRAELDWLASFGPPDRCHERTAAGTRCVRAARPGESYCGIHLVEPTVPAFDPSAVKPPKRPSSRREVDWRPAAAKERAAATRQCGLCGVVLHRLTKHLCGSCRSEWKQIKLSVMAGMWADGWTLVEIAEGIGSSRQSVSNTIGIARKETPGCFPLREPSKRPRTRKGKPLPASAIA